MARVTFGNRCGRVRVTTTRSEGPKRPVEEIVREMKAAVAGQETYRERSLALHGLVCARCGRSFEGGNRHLLTVHHRDGNHLNNPADGSNWENLCVYCHEDVHSRELLGDFMAGTTAPAREEALVYRDETAEGGLGRLGDRLRQALEAKKKPQRR